MATINGTAGNDNLAGGNANDLIKGLAGDDNLYGGLGHDTLDGGLGNDSMEGGLGNDTYHVDSTGDKIKENANAGTDTVIASVNYTLGANLENLTLTGIANLNGKGNALNNKIIGNDGNNRLEGLEGNDNINGGKGSDRIYGGIGNDSLLGGEGNDFIVGGGTTFNEVDTLAGGTGADTFSFVRSNGTLAYNNYGNGDLGDYAQITDFSIAQGDKLQLDGYAAHYRLVQGAFGVGSQSTALVYIGSEQDQFELLAILKNVSIPDHQLQSISTFV
jgi:Ca2+-binding RTX toxin-like protein